MGPYRREGHPEWAPVYMAHALGGRAVSVLRQVYPYFEGSKKLRAKKVLETFPDSGYLAGKISSKELFAGLNHKGRESSPSTPPRRRLRIHTKNFIRIEDLVEAL